MCVGYTLQRINHSSYGCSHLDSAGRVVRGALPGSAMSGATFVFRSPAPSADLEPLLQQQFVVEAEWYQRPFLGSTGSPRLVIWWNPEPQETEGITIERGWNVTDEDLSRSMAWSAGDDAELEVPPRDGWRVPAWSDRDALLALAPVPLPPSTPPPQVAAATRFVDAGDEMTVASPITSPDDDDDLAGDAAARRGRVRAVAGAPGVRRDIAGPLPPVPKPRPASASRSGLPASSSRGGMPPPPPPPSRRGGSTSSARPLAVRPSSSATPRPPSSSSSSATPRPPSSSSTPGVASSSWASDTVRRGGWFNKCQRLAEAVLNHRDEEAVALALEYYAGPHPY